MDKTDDGRWRRRRGTYCIVFYWMKQNTVTIAYNLHERSVVTADVKKVSLNHSTCRPVETVSLTCITQCHSLCEHDCLGCKYRFGLGGDLDVDGRKISPQAPGGIGRNGGVLSAQSKGNGAGLCLLARAVDRVRFKINSGFE